MKTHRKKQESQVIIHINANTKKTQRIINKQGAGGKNNTPDSLVEKTRKNDRNINFVEKNKC